MTDDNLTEFLGERVIPTRAVAHMAYPVDSGVPSTAVMLDCTDDSMAVVILPTFAEGVLHLECHFFVDGERVQPETTFPSQTNGCCEHLLTRPTPAHML